jgi:mannosyl-oligosaccharide alpha-1,2-mannosidase
MLLSTTRRGILQATAASGLLASAPGLAAPARDTDWHALAADVKAEMAFAWRGYRARAWGHDQVKPVSGGHEEFFFPGQPMGLSIIEALDTLWLMGLDDEFEEGLNWVLGNLHFDIDAEIQLFEVSICVLGGLLAAHHACGDARLVALAHDLASRLIPAFERSRTGMPYRFVNLRTGAVRHDPVTFPAEVGSYLPEWGVLAKLSGDRRFYDLPKAAVKAMFDRRSAIGLLADTIDVETGKWLSRQATVGPPSDSYYEYLWDAWQLHGDRDTRRWYDILTNAILKHQQVRVDGRLWFARVDFETGQVLNHHQSELDAFYGGLLGQGGAMKQGVAYTLSWAAVQDRFGVIPEGFDCATFAATTPSNALRPELADAALNLWLLDGDPGWRHVCAEHFETMKRTSRAAFGYSGIADVTKTPMTLDDRCPGYWWAEQMKYYWLIFSDTPRFDYRTNYLSTEGKVLLGLRRGRARA